MFSNLADQGHRENAMKKEKKTTTDKYSLLPYWTEANGITMFVFTLVKHTEIKTENNLMVSKKSTSIQSMLSLQDHKWRESLHRVSIF